MSDAAMQVVPQRAASWRLASLLPGHCRQASCVAAAHMCFTVCRWRMKGHCKRYMSPGHDHALAANELCANELLNVAEALRGFAADSALWLMAWQSGPVAKL